MKGIVFKTGLICLWLILIGCVNLDNRFMDESITRDNHAVLLIHDYDLFVVINGDRLTTTGTFRYPMVPLRPGNHRLNIRYDRASQSGSTITSITTGWVSMDYIFEAGHYYTLSSAFVSGGRIEFIITDVTNDNNDIVAKMQKKLNRSKFPKNSAPSNINIPLLSMANEAEPTIFEGRWIKEDEWIEFKGNSYLHFRRGRRNDDPRFQETFPLVNLYETGVFEFDENKFTFTPLRVINFHYPHSTGDWQSSRSRSPSKEFTYSVNDNSITFTSNSRDITSGLHAYIETGGINRPYGTFIKQETQNDEINLE